MNSKSDNRLTIRVGPNNVIAALPLIFYLANLYRMFSGTMIIYYLVFLVTGLAGLFVWLFFNNYDLRRFTLFAVLYIFTGVINYIYISNTTLLNVALSVLFFGITAVLLTRQWSIILGGVSFYISFFVLAIGLYRKGINALTISSNNYISILIIIAAVLYYIAVENERQIIKMVDIIPAILAFTLSVWASGRGGILSSGILLVCMLLIFMRTLASKNIRKIMMLFIVLILMLVFLMGFHNQFINWFMSLGKFSSAGFNSSARESIWQAYIMETFKSVKYILLGAPKYYIPIILRFEGNPHNSFIQLHSTNGLVMFVLFILITCRALKAYINKQEYIKFSMLIVMLIRGMTDTFIFGLYGMPIMLFLIYYPTVKKKSYIY